MGTTPMFAPDGSLGDIPTARIADAVKAGFKIGVDLTAPNGAKGTIPIERIHDALKAGFTPFVPTEAQANANPAIAPVSADMKTSAAPQVVRAAIGSLPGVGALAGGAIASPGVATTPVGVGLGAAAGESARLGLNRAIFGNQEPSNTSAQGIKSTIGQGAMAGATEGLMQQALPAAQAVSEALPGNKMAVAGQKFQELKGAIGNHTVEMTDRLGNALTDIKQAADTGSTLPSVINKFVTRIADTDKGPLSYEEARQFYSNVSDLSASEKMAAKTKDLPLINEFKHALGETIADTADQAGRLQQYQQAMKGYAQGAQSQEKLDAVKEFAKSAIGKAAIGAVAGGGGYGGYTLLKSLMK